MPDPLFYPHNKIGTFLILSIKKPRFREIEYLVQGQIAPQRRSWDWNLELCPSFWVRRAFLKVFRSLLDDPGVEGRFRSGFQVPCGQTGLLPPTGLPDP